MSTTTIVFHNLLAHGFVRRQADVYDHMEYILTSLDMFANIGENLINYTFNVSPLSSFASQTIKY